MRLSKHSKSVHRRWRMMQIKHAISDFLGKDTKTKYKLTRKFLIQLFILSIAVWMPLLIIAYQASVERDRNQVILDGLTLEKKWVMVSKGLAKLDCEDNAPERLRESGYDPSTPAAINYAAEHGFCRFVATPTKGTAHEPCQSIMKQVRGEWVNTDCMFEPQ